MTPAALRDTATPTAAAKVVTVGVRVIGDSSGIVIVMVVHISAAIPPAAVAATTVTRSHSVAKSSRATVVVTTLIGHVDIDGVVNEATTTPTHRTTTSSITVTITPAPKVLVVIQVTQTVQTLRTRGGEDNGGVRSHSMNAENERKKKSDRALTPLRSDAHILLLLLVARTHQW